ncbi:MAG: phage tail sheath subtilisin-like domain-containing protein, partial [Nitrososphaera sp.]|nr:phage tail sheath subtilisin-like domain-containing protein [Nitrososphaera sp.]
GSQIAMSGLMALSDPEQVDIDLIAVPGHASTNIAIAIIDLCQNIRGDCFGIIEPPFGLTVTEIVQWQNGVSPLNDVRFDSNFAALYWPWVKIRDGFNRIDVWVPPAGNVLATFAQSDTLAAPWFPAAGLNRGRVPGVLSVFTNPTLVERDEMYGSANAVNPIIEFVGQEGFFIWGNKTLQRAQSALDRINVRRMMLFVEKQIARAAKILLFEPHTPALRASFIQIAANILDIVKNGDGLIDYIVQCDEILNTADVIDRNELRARIAIQPTRAVEFIFIEFTVNRTGSFAESSANF